MANSEPSAIRHPLSVICCACGDHLRGPAPTEALYDAHRISHGYCPDCYAEAMSHIREVGA